jgi:hypothetical protein
MSRRRHPDHLHGLVSVLNRHGYAADVRPEARLYEARWTAIVGRRRMLPICRAGNPDSLVQALAALRRLLRQDGVRHG